MDANFGLLFFKKGDENAVPVPVLKAGELNSIVCTIVTRFNLVRQGSLDLSIKRVIKVPIRLEARKTQNAALKTDRAFLENFNAEQDDFLDYLHFGQPYDAMSAKVLAKNLLEEKIFQRQAQAALRVFFLERRCCGATAAQPEGAAALGASTKNTNTYRSWTKWLLKRIHMRFLGQRLILMRNTDPSAVVTPVSASRSSRSFMIGGGSSSRSDHHGGGALSALTFGAGRHDGESPRGPFAPHQPGGPLSPGAAPRSILAEIQALLNVNA